MRPQASGIATVVLVGGDPVVGQAVARLLQSAAYAVRFLSDLDVAELDGLPADVQLPLLAPDLSPDRRDFLTRLASSSQPGMSILKMVMSPRERQRGHVLWPCRIDTLKREVEVGLRSKSSPEASMP